MSDIAEWLAQPFLCVTDLLRVHTAEHGERRAVICEGREISYAELDAEVDRFAASLQRDGVAPCDAVAIAAHASIDYVVAFLGALRAGAVVAPLAPSSSPASLAGMIANSGARLLFLDEDVERVLESVATDVYARRVHIGRPGALDAWLEPVGAKPAHVEIQPQWGFNIIYSSGTTGTPKGIVQAHAMRWAYAVRSVDRGYGPHVVTMISTPLYSNTTLVSFFPTLTLGGTVVLMPKFDVKGFLELAQRYRATHAMLVPVQYQRIMDFPEFDRYDLSSFEAKFSTSAPFGARLKADIVKRWPGALTEYYGMTEGGGSCELVATAYPDKLHTVGKPIAGHDIRLIDEAGREVPQGEIGEVVGHSPAMMTGYHNQPEKTAEAEWYDPSGKRFIRTGDLGRFDEDGFLTLLDRKKDMIISGGFNVYPSDLEAEIRTHADVYDVAVVGIESQQWGETPVAFVVPHAQATVSEEGLKTYANGRLGKMQRVADVVFVDAMPRSPIGKVLKRELRERYTTIKQDATCKISTAK
ncbi:class I adenylate-forming enzyme family protein [Pararobbsia silviterrae]|uniref:4-coumarate--CoA ligase n=1 Tax=Pararobbsia silviterrae TaxID=1792498 RepID=A0A494Y0N4_9BURK|nr:class I adenylate-forming enzyme family protein [Pararobbsia silviterrae]RKP55809.1 4-coumarate--CoA ligase [Pararobbsia silviterrae]